MAGADEFLANRKKKTEERFRRVQGRVRAIEPLLGDFATLYATGSYGRGEASDHSDLDVFILTETDSEKRPKLRPLDTIRVQAALIDAATQEGLPPFSDEGAYLKPHTITDMIEKLGGPDDDYENLFTARMLLLLESRPIVGSLMYERAIDRVLDEYWRDFDENAERFLPIYLTNDLVRYWKVLCLNYEANTRYASNLNKRRLNNYKLKHSRLLTCYSALLTSAICCGPGTRSPKPTAMP
jgi:predicted nucleotidyltransferase